MKLSCRRLQMLQELSAGDETKPLYALKCVPSVVNIDSLSLYN